MKSLTYNAGSSTFSNRSLVDINYVDNFIRKNKTSFYNESGEFMWEDPNSNLWKEITMLNHWIVTDTSIKFSIKCLKSNSINLPSVKPLAAPIGKLFWLDYKYRVDLYKEIIKLKNEV